MGNPGDRDPTDAWLNAEIEPLAPPPGTFERIRRRGAQSGSSGALPLINNPRVPCVPLVAAHGSGKPRGRCVLKRGLPALAGLEGPLAGCVHEAGLVTVGGAGPPVVGEIAGGYRLAGDLQPPPFPLLGGLGWLIRR